MAVVLNQASTEKTLRPGHRVRRGDIARQVVQQVIRLGDLAEHLRDLAWLLAEVRACHPAVLTQSRQLTGGASAA